MMKVLYILTKSGIGGAQKYVKDLTENLDKNKFESKILYGGPIRGESPQSSDCCAVGRATSNGINKSNVRWLSNKTYPWFLFLNDWLAVFELVKIFKKERPDIVHLNSSKAGVIGAMAIRIYRLRLIFGSPMSQRLEPNFRTSDFPRIVFTAHGWVFNHTNELNWFIRNFYIFLHKISSLFIDKIICVSEYDYNLALEYDICEPEKLAKIHNGIDANIKFLNKKEARENLQFTIYNLQFTKNKNVLKNNWKWVGSIGRLVKEKNYETFIEATKSIPNAYFFIIGEGQELRNLQFTIYNLQLGNRFFIVPPSGNDAQYLKAFDVFVMSSIKEGLPYILLEAMAAELPIVITEAGGMPELIKDHENGLMVAQKNPEALARAIGGLIENPVVAKELAIKAKEVVTKKFGLKKMVAETEKEYLALPNIIN